MAPASTDSLLIGGRPEGGCSSGGILANANEASPCKKSTSSDLASVIKSAFKHPPTPGRLAKTDGKPLGKSFQRTQPLTAPIAGGEILQHDPRPQPNTGDGIPPPSPGTSSSSSALAPTSDCSSVHSSALSDASSSSQNIRDGASEGDGSVTSEDTDERSRLGAHQRGATESNASLSSSATSNACSIRFAPLPTSGRLKRANSITIGVAARSQLLQSQGTPKVNFNPPASTRIGRSGRSHDVDVIDVGDEIKRGVAKAWNAMRKRSNSPASSKPVSESASPNFPSAVVDDGEEGEGTKTPRSDTYGSPAAPGMPLERRLSTGTFLKDASLRDIQQQRRREFGWDDVDDDDFERRDAAAYMSSLGRPGASVVARRIHDWSRDKTPASDAQQSNGAKEISTSDVGRPTPSANLVSSSDHRSDVDTEGESTDADTDEDAAAQQIADDAMAHHSAKATSAAGVEKFERSSQVSKGVVKT